MSFDWMGSHKTDAKHQRSAALEMYREEVRLRANLLRQLGHKKTHAAHVIAANLAWEFELLGGCPISSEIEGLVESAYGRKGQ